MPVSLFVVAILWSWLQAQKVTQTSSLKKQNNWFTCREDLIACELCFNGNFIRMSRTWFTKASFILAFDNRLRVHWIGISKTSQLRDRVIEPQSIILFFFFFGMCVGFIYFFTKWTVVFCFWSIIALQCCVSFCRTVKWISSMCTYIPSLLDLPHLPHPVPPLWVITEHWARLPCFPLVICFIHGSDTCQSQSLNPSHLPCPASPSLPHVHMSILYIWVSFLPWK